MVAALLLALQHDEARAFRRTNEEQHAFVERSIFDLRFELGDALHVLATDLGDHVAGFQPGFVSRAAVVDRGDDDAAGVFEAELLGDVACQRTDLEAQLVVLLGLLAFGLIVGRANILLAVVGGHLFHAHCQLDLFAVTRYGHWLLGADRRPTDDALKLRGRANLRAREIHDHVLRLEAGVGSRRLGLNIGHQRSLVVGQLKLRSQRGIDLLNADAQVGAVDFAVLRKLRADPLGEINRDREADALESAARRSDGRVDADYFALQIDQRPTAITRIDGRVSLNELVIARDAD